VFLVVSQTAVNAIVALLNLLPQNLYRLVMRHLEAVSAHELVAHGRNERRNQRRNERISYNMLLCTIRSFRCKRLERRFDQRSGNATAEDSEDSEDSDTAWDSEDSDTAEETAALLVWSNHAKTVLDRIIALENNLSQIAQLHERVLSALDEVDTDVIVEEVSDLSSVPIECINGENDERSSV
jgi:hypothetical protein